MRGGMEVGENKRAKVLGSILKREGVFQGLSAEGVAARGCGKRFSRFFDFISQRNVFSRFLFDRR